MSLTEPRHYYVPASQTTEFVPSWEQHPPPQPSSIPWGWIALWVLCGLLTVALIVVVVLGATGVIFHTECIHPLQALAVAHTSPTVEPSRFPTNTVEHIILKIPSYDPIALSRQEEQQLTREQPVLDHVSRTSTFEKVTPGTRPPLSIAIPSRKDVQGAPIPPRIPKPMMPFTTERGIDRGVPVVKSVSSDSGMAAAAAANSSSLPRYLSVPPAVPAEPPSSSSSSSGADSSRIHSSEVHELHEAPANSNATNNTNTMERRVFFVPPAVDDTLVHEAVLVDTELLPPPPASPNSTSKLLMTGGGGATRSNTPFTEPDYSVGTVSMAPGSNGLHRFIEYVVYINLNENQTQRAAIEQEIDKLNLPEFVPRERLSAVQRSNTELGNFLSKIACLTKALSLKKNALILEDDFRLDQSPSEILAALTLVDQQFGNRWDVVVWDQQADEWQKVCEEGEVHILRLLHSRGGTGFLVNKLYVPRLLAYWIQRLRTVLQKEQYQEARHIAAIKTDLQRWDMWLTFQHPLGHKLNDQWHYLNDLEHATDATGTCQKITLLPALERRRVAVCHLATGKYNQFVSAIQTDCYLKFLKMHHLEFFLFTDQASSYPARTEEGALLHTYAIDAQGYPQDNLYRFHYLLQAETELATFDYVYYMDVDYRLYQHPAEKQLMVDGIVATAHLHNIVEKRDGSRRHIGSPETRPESTACIRSDETMTIYYASSFHGGASGPYLSMCQTLKDQIDTDASQQVTAKWLDESHLNRYLLDHPPATVLSQSYIFSERCLDLECRDPMCNALRESRIQPIMGTQM